MNRQHNDALHHYADQVGLRAAAPVDRAWRELWAAMRPGMLAAAENYRRAAQILGSLPQRLYGALWDGMAALLHWSYDNVASKLARTLPAAAFHATPVLEDREVRDVPGIKNGFVRARLDARRAMVTVNVAALDAAWSRDQDFYIPPGGGGDEVPGRRAGFVQWMQHGEPIEAPRITIDEDGRVSFADGRHRFSVLRDMGLERIPVVIDRWQAARARAELTPPVPAIGAGATVQSLLFPPLAAQRVHDFLSGILPSADWAALGDAGNANTPHGLANLIASRYAAGDSTQDVAKAVLPYFEGSRVRAQRAARTFGAFIGTKATLEAGDQLGDLVAGYEVTDPGGPTARKDHMRRSGTRYWRNPRPGQYGFDVMPQPPLDRGGPFEIGAGVKWNCRCWLSPILASDL